VVLRATAPVWGTAHSAETAMKYPVSQLALSYLCSSFQRSHKGLRLAVQRQNDCNVPLLDF